MLGFCEFSVELKESCLVVGAPHVALRCSARRDFELGSDIMCFGSQWVASFCAIRLWCTTQSIWWQVLSGVRNDKQHCAICSPKRMCRFARRQDINFVFLDMLVQDTATAGKVTTGECDDFSEIVVVGMI